jgi:hypothetical protein
VSPFTNILYGDNQKTRAIWKTYIKKYRVKKFAESWHAENPMYSPKLYIQLISASRYGFRPGSLENPGYHRYLVVRIAL